MKELLLATLTIRHDYEEMKSEWAGGLKSENMPPSSQKHLEEAWGILGLEGEAMSYQV